MPSGKSSRANFTETEKDSRPFHEPERRSPDRPASSIEPQRADQEIGAPMLSMNLARTLACFDSLSPRGTSGERAGEEPERGAIRKTKHFLCLFAPRNIFYPIHRSVARRKRNGAFEKDPGNGAV